MAKNSGTLFEHDFKKSVPEGIYCKRLMGAGGKYKGVNNEGDFLLYKCPHMFLVELKSHKGKALPFDKLRANQVELLYEYSYIEGIKSGFIFNFRDYDETYYIPAKKIYNYIVKGERKSFPIDWCREVGIKIPQYKKRTRFTYNVEYLIYMLRNED